MLTLVGAALVLAAPAVGLPALGSEVARTVRTGICIVGGDVCRTSDAVAAGLTPCTVADHVRGTSQAMSVLVVRIGHDASWTVGERSDGSVAVTHASTERGGGFANVGVELGPVRFSAGGGLGIAIATGTGWEFPDAASAQEFLAAVRGGSAPDDGRWPPAWHSGDGGLATSVGARARLGVPLKNDRVAGIRAGIEASAGSALGVRLGRGTTTLYFRIDATTLRASDGVGDASAVGPSQPPTLVEYTRDADGPRELAFRTVVPAASGRVSDIVARLDLRVPANRAVAGRVLGQGLPWPPSLFRDVRELIRYTATVGTVEQSTYEVRDASKAVSIGVKAGLEVGADLRTTVVDRRLVSAVARTHGSPLRERVDCLPQDGSA
jgi:hypothetical protein